MDAMNNSIFQAMSEQASALVETQGEGIVMALTAAYLAGLERAARRPHENLALQAAAVSPGRPV